MIQSADTLDSTEVNKLTTPAIERLYIEMSNVSTTLMPKYSGYDISSAHPLGPPTNLNELNNNSNLNCTYPVSLNPMDYQSNSCNSNANVNPLTSNLQSLNSLTIAPHSQSTLTNHHNNLVNQHHLTNSVFHNDSILQHHQQHHHQRTPRTSPNYIDTHSQNITNCNVPEVNYHHLSNHSTTAQPIPITCSTPMPLSPSPSSLTILTSTSEAAIVSGGPGIPTNDLLSLMPIKSEPDVMENQITNNLTPPPPPQPPLSSSSASGVQPPPPPSLTVSPPVSPINMEQQEKFKLERKRQRNRIAASKCRKRKLEKIHLLEKRVNELKDENKQLSSAVNKLRDHVCCLKQEVIQHINNGCPIASPDHQM